MTELDKKLDKLWHDVRCSTCLTCPIGGFEFGERAKSLIKEVIDEVIGDMEYRETEDMSLKTWSAEDLKAFGRNELRNEQREKLNEILVDK